MVGLENRLRGPPPNFVRQAFDQFQVALAIQICLYIAETGFAQDVYTERDTLIPLAFELG